MRPKYPKTDKAHNVVKQFMRDHCSGEFLAYASGDEINVTDPRVMVGIYRNVPVMIIDTSAMGGCTVDYLAMIGRYAWALEVKSSDAQRDDLTPGETEFVINFPGESATVVTLDDVRREFDEAIDRVQSIREMEY